MSKPENRAELYAMLDALEEYETWLVLTMPDGIKPHQAAHAYNASSSPTRTGEVMMKRVDKGYLFVRIR